MVQFLGWERKRVKGIGGRRKLTYQNFCYVDKISLRYMSKSKIIRNLSLGHLNCQSVPTILKKVGTIVEMEEPIVDGKIVRDYIRVRVLVDVTKPLLVRCWILRVDLPKL